MWHSVPHRKQGFITQFDAKKKGGHDVHPFIERNHIGESSMASNVCVVTQTICEKSQILVRASPKNLHRKKYLTRILCLTILP